MTDVSEYAPPATPAPGWLGQATAVEQSRAVAEVAGAIMVARQVPRRYDLARTAMQQSCRMQRLADRAFFSFRRGGGPVTGPTIHLARELARCWQNIQYGIAELRRDDESGLSEMQAFAWDVEANTRASTVFIVPHGRDTTDKDGTYNRKPLESLRDVYENNANMGSRRLRQQIYAVLPPWFTEEAEEICRATLQKGDGKPLEERREAAVAAFIQIGVQRDQLEQKLGRKVDRWTIYDLPQLMITHRSLIAGELTIEEAFPAIRVTREEIAAQAAEQEAGA
jgi:hypothetical protein